MLFVGQVGNHDLRDSIEQIVCVPLGDMTRVPAHSTAGKKQQQCDTERESDGHTGSYRVDAESLPPKSAFA